MTEQQPFTVLAEHPGYEVRHYPGHTIAEVTVRGEFERAGNAAFRPLVSYISGRNVRGQRIAMTAPVVQAPQADGLTHRVAFVMPAGTATATLPEPADPALTMRDVPEEWAAVERFSGRWSEASFARHAAELRARIESDGYEVAGPVRFARFDPPWTPWFMRHNEVVLPIRKPGRDSRAT